MCSIFLGQTQSQLGVQFSKAQAIPYKAQEGKQIVCHLLFDFFRGKCVRVCVCVCVRVHWHITTVFCTIAQKRSSFALGQLLSNQSARICQRSKWASSTCSISSGAQFGCVSRSAITARSGAVLRHHHNSQRPKNDTQMQNC